MKNTKSPLGKYIGVVMTIAATITLLALFTFSLLVLSTPTNAAPPAAPTPVADFLVPAVQPRAFNFETVTAITADANTTGVDVLGLGAVDIQYVIDHVPSGEVQTTTLTVQYSNDNSNWVSGVALVSSSAADGTSITRVPVFGRWMRINKDVSSNSIAVTTTLTAVGR